MKSANQFLEVMLGLLGILSATCATMAGEQCPKDVHEPVVDVFSCDVAMSDWEQLQVDLQAKQNECTGNSPQELKWIDLELRWTIAEAGGIPKWDGTQLLDASDTVCGLAKVDDDAKIMLAKLNYWEQAYGQSSIQPELRNRRFSLGEERAAIAHYIGQLAEKGINVELDWDEGLWKVVKDGVD